MLEIGKISFLFLAFSSALGAPDCSGECGEWSEWTICSKSCNQGLRLRNRTCEVCNETTETQTCNDRPCLDITTRLTVIVVVSIVIIATMTAVLLVIFFVKGTESSQGKSGSVDSNKQLRAQAPNNTNLLDVVNVNKRVLHLQRMADSKSSLQTSSTTLKDCGESRLWVAQFENEESRDLQAGKADCVLRRYCYCFLYLSFMALGFPRPSAFPRSTMSDISTFYLFLSRAQFPRLF